MQTLRTSGFLFRVKRLSKGQCFPATPRLNGAVFSTNKIKSPQNNGETTREETDTLDIAVLS
jgi:hypothetical protein